MEEKTAQTARGRDDPAGDAPCFEKYSGTSLNTAPFPIPAHTATIKQPNVKRGMVNPKESKTPDKVRPANTNIRTTKGLDLSDSIPPTGRRKVAKAIKPAVLSPASTLLNSK